MKLGIVTIIGFSNYGNRLQNIAVEQILQCFGYETETLRIRCRKSEEARRGIKCKIKRMLPYPIYKILKQRNENKLDVLDRQRLHNFMEFSIKYTHLKEEIWFDKDCSNILNTEEYAYFVTGSDQVWNPDFAGNDLYFLAFVQEEKRIALAASIGYEELDESLLDYYTDRLNQMAYISVREKSAQHLVQKLTGREAALMVDPTLLVDSRYWQSIMECPQLEFPHNYMLSFFLGEEPREEIEFIAESEKLPVIHMNQKQFSEWYVLSPAHFLYMVKHAEYVLTDSFHAAAFSINFNTSFCVFRRKDKILKNMFSRMETLLELFALQDRIYTYSEGLTLEKVWQGRWEKVNQILDAEREKSMQWLSMALGEHDKI